MFVIAHDYQSRMSVVRWYIIGCGQLVTMYIHQVASFLFVCLLLFFVVVLFCFCFFAPDSYTFYITCMLFVL